MNRKFVLAALAVCLTGLLLTGCSQDSRKTKHAERAESFFKAGDYDRAELEYRNLLRLESTNQVALRNLAVMFFEQGRLLSSFALLAKASKLHPEDFEVRLKYAMALQSIGKTRESRDEVLQVLSLQPTNEEALMLLVDASISTNDLDDARQRLGSLNSVGGGLAGYQIALGTVALRNRDTNTAAECYRRALSANPQSGAAHMAMGSLYVISKDLTNALAEFQQAAALSPLRSPYQVRYADFLVSMDNSSEAREFLGQLSKKVPDYLPALMRLAQLSLAERRFAECEAGLKSIFARDAAHIDAMMVMARLRVAQNQPDDAIKELERMLKIIPRLPQVHFQIAIARLMQNDLPAAAVSLDAALAIQPDYPEAILLLAELNIRRGTTTLAVDALTKLVEQRPALIQAQLLLATAYQAARKPDSALGIYQNLSLKFPANPQPVFLIGLVQSGLGRRSEARLSFEKALNLAPGYFSALEQLVNLDLLERHFDDAEQRAQREVERSGTNTAPYLLLAKVHLARTNLASAESILLKALEVSPESAPVNALLAQVYVISKQHEQALDKLRQMVARNTNDVASWARIAELHSASSNHLAAKAAYESALAIDPKVLVGDRKYPQVLNNLAWLYSEHLGEPKRAYELASKARELQPGNPYTADTFGWVLYRNGDYIRALALLQESVRALSVNAREPEPEVLFHLGMIHYMMGEETASRVALEKAVQMGAEDVEWKREARQRLLILDTDESTVDAARMKELESLAAQSHKDPILLSRLGTFAELAGDWGKATVAYEKALQINTNLVPVMVRLARVYSKDVRNQGSALTLARRARSLSPNDPGIAHILGRLAFAVAQSASDFQWANGLLQESARSFPTNSEVLYDAALARYAIGEEAAATALMQKLVGLPVTLEHSNAANLFIEMNRYHANPDSADAASRLALVLQNQPNYVPALMVSASKKERQGEFEMARSSYEKILKIYPLFAPANKALAILYREKLNDFAKAYEHASKARELLPQDLQVARLLGGLAYERAEYPRSIQLLKESMAAYSQDAELFYTLGLAHYKLKQPRESKEAFDKALILAPNSKQAAEARRILAEFN